ncbi:hypothetical protein L1987_44613 [Smallanthus sonchifolius]|uniref:Uncharacterized protein n=1 Tax=Smallanthus sonchifolius TaxID=185202 RepID=A0ACB9GPX8_9ASTR|nr:hypothetical protein L1987_44613 [Smallanthus sonchifolius]
MNKQEYISSISLARFVLLCDSLGNDLPKAMPVDIVDPVKISRFVKGEEDEEKCAICVEEYQADKLIGILPCKHTYHEECIKNWFKKKKECPICRELRSGSPRLVKHNYFLHCLHKKGSLDVLSFCELLDSNEYFNST